ncbi:Hypothetical_protein [Hexamita inflata]|uniref:Hypothetical_protein n=1 Tax=Hexamita inflata TaxID=28002 RepID=A0AA86UND3_9EUKA|nr:Hypothetical protein HINF_LOCUS45781 [Hexamita inflata]
MNLFLSNEDHRLTQIQTTTKLAQVHHREKVLSSEVDELFTDRHQEQLVQPIIMQQKNNFSSAVSEELFKEEQRTIYKMSVQLNKSRILLKHLLSKCDELHEQANKNLQRIHDIKIIFFK